MMHRQMIIDDFATWDHGHFTMTAFSAPIPRHRQQLQAVPGYDGYLDLSDLPLGRPVYDARTVSAIFECSHGSREDRQKVFDRLIAKVNGRCVKLTDPDHPGSYFYGRVYMTPSFNKPSYGELKLEATCAPWRYSLIPACELVKIQTPSDNLLIGAEVTRLDDLSNDFSHTIDNTTVGSFTSSGDVGRVTIWEISLAPNTSYMVSANIRDGRGTWGCAASKENPEWVKGLVHTGDSGKLYLRMMSYAAEWFVLYPFVILRASQVPVVENGVTPVKATLDLSVSFPGAAVYSLMFGTAGLLSHVYDGTITLQPGLQPVVLYSWLQSPEAPVPISWNRGDF